MNKQLKFAKILVTGAGGHLGSNVVKELRDHGYEVRASIRPQNTTAEARLLQLGAEVVRADTRSAERVNEICEGVDAIVHCAAVFSMYSRDPEREIMTPALEGTRNIMNGASQQGVKRVVLTSSVVTLGFRNEPSLPLTEQDWNATPQSSYVRAKTESEKLAWALAQSLGVDLVTVLPAGILGPGITRHTPVTRSFSKVLRGAVPVSPPFAYSCVDVRDAAIAHRLVLEGGASGERYIASAHFSSFHALMKDIQALRPQVPVPKIKVGRRTLLTMAYAGEMGYRALGIPKLIEVDEVRELAERRQEASSAKLTSELGWKPRLWQETVRDTIEWLESHPLALQ